MDSREEFQQLIEQLSYYDHANDTDVSAELLELVQLVKEDGFSEDEAVAMLSECFETLKQNSVITEQEHIALVQSVIYRLPKLLFPRKYSRKLSP